MCGIVGIVDEANGPVSAAVLENMTASLAHRGPDERGLHIEPGVGLGHRRLSIIDLKTGSQPMGNADGSLWLTYNGELYNYIELRAELEEAGRRFSTHSDTEVVLAMYEAYGPECVKRFNGQWALGIWDAGQRELFLSRDRLGIRPLFVTRAEGKFMFASEVKALLAHPDVSPELDVSALEQVFTFWSTVAPRTVFTGIRQVPPGHSMVVRGGVETLYPYWTQNFDAPTFAGSLDECAELLRALLVDASRIRLRADVPVGAYLSGGLDSSAISAVIRHFSDAPLKTFSVAFADQEYDESTYQADVARHLGTQHETIRCGATDICAVFPEVVRLAETPLLRTAPAPLFLLSRLVREQGFKVVMTGEGADEMLGGYDIFREAKIRRFCGSQPSSLRRLQLFKRLYPYMPALQSQSAESLAAFFQIDGASLADPCFSHLPRWEMTSGLRRFLSPDVTEQLDWERPRRDLRGALPASFSAWDPLCQAQYLETATLMSNYILSSQGDRMAMGNSVEGRFPFLDHRLVEFAATIPAKWKVRGLDEKHALKRAVGSLVPRRVAERSKQPYRAPDVASFFDPNTGRALADYVEELATPAALARTGIFHPRAVEKLWAKARSGKAQGVRDSMAFVGILSTQLLAHQVTEISNTGTARHEYARN
ncbi:MAG: asparagine synthase (glutamine-hydrolyzing) [Planctomycetota bacterium]|nr:asparagine synthase (glutamine-hydrolyzing) [Planctomycetota bacterium]